MHQNSKHIDQKTEMKQDKYSTARPTLKGWSKRNPTVGPRLARPKTYQSQTFFLYLMVLLLCFYVSFVLSSIVITFLGNEGASRCASFLHVRLVLWPHVLQTVHRSFTHDPKISIAIWINLRPAEQNRQ